MKAILDSMFASCAFFASIDIIFQNSVIITPHTNEDAIKKNLRKGAPLTEKKNRYTVELQWLEH